MADSIAPASSDLILDAAVIFDADAVAAAIDADLADLNDPRDMRARAVAHLGKAYDHGFQAIGTAYRAAPRATRAATTSYTWLTDRLVAEILRVATTYIHPLENPTRAERLGVMAVGGYGRAEMAPYSDIDLLFLIPFRRTEWAEAVVETMLYMFWDMRLKIGHATRTVADCLRLGKEDFTIRTALLESRYLGGDGDLAADFDKRLWNDLFKGTGPEFVEAKLVERAERHKKQGGQRYMVEPNVKEGKGGLRDLQSLFWIAKYLHRAHSSRELVALGMFSEAEYAIFARAENFLWTVRCHLHLIARRASEQMTFDAQVEIARILGYEDSGGRRAVEHFMQDYFRHATQVGELTRIFLTGLEAQHVKRQPRVGELLSSAGRRLRTRLSPGYKRDQGRLNIASREAFLADPLNLLRVFKEGLRTGYLLHPDVMRLVSANLHRIDDDMRASPEANRIFLDILLDFGNPERGLRRMNELGVLGAFIPDFQKIVAMMQFNMYHHYTVDEHTIQCVSVLSRIEHGELVEDLPVASGILKKGVNRQVLFVAVLLHDIAKGRKEDHSIKGAEIARELCPRLGLDPAECDTVEWLVRNHLLMSDVAQKRDLTDPRTVRQFAETVGSRTRLKLLTVLTVCDIMGVGPGTWNNWKAQLLRDLYHATRSALTSGVDEASQTRRVDEAKAALFRALPDWDQSALEAEAARHYQPYWQGLDTETHAVFAELLKGLGEDEIRSDFKPDADRDATRVCFALADHPGIFSRLAGALALVGANVVDAKTYTSSDGFATPVFWVQDVTGKPYEQSRLKRLSAMVNKALRGEVVAREALRDRDRIKKRERDFIVPTEITFDNEGSEIYTIIEVDTRDRPGLLYDLTRTISANNVYIASAVIATYGVQAVDVFYVKDMFGLKLHTKSRRDALERKLREAIERGVEGAMAQ
ncbi:MAG: [protein-PII] uridylyltransferase [Rhodobacteraceae bacterium]|nr:[protein-PII] uridylyltransferase [Paracoccaceae bacterium]